MTMPLDRYDISSHMLIDAKNISFERNGKKILDNVSIAINENDFVTVIGPNGAGKSTLIKILMGIIRADYGAVIKKDGLKIGYVPQKFIAEPTLPISVKEFLLLNNKANKKKITDIMSEVEIDYPKRLLHQLSGGEMQKVLLARALLNSPDMLILDEPAQNLDIGNQLKFYKLLEKVHKDMKCSILMISHDLHMVMAKSNQVVCLFHHVCCSGTPQVVTRDPEFIKIFGSDMSNMMAYYQHHHTHTHADHIHGEDCEHV
jgi:zinc transport system ATP-binding protein